LRPGIGGGIEFYSYARIFGPHIEEARKEIKPLLQNLIRSTSSQRNLILSAIIELRGTGRLMCGDLLRAF